MQYQQTNIYHLCGQTVTDYSHNVYDSVTEIDSNTFVYSFEIDSKVIEDGQPCEIHKILSTEITAVEAFCDLFPYNTDGCCEDEYGDFTIIPNPIFFDILTPHPGIDNEKEVITLEATPGYNQYVYNWQYYHPYIEDWVQFPEQFLGKHSIEFSAVDLFGEDASDFIGVSIQYKLELCNGWSPKLPYIYIFINGSPKLIPPIIPHKTSCTGAEDGSFTMTVDRNLEEGEELVVSVYDANFPDGGIVKQADTSVLVDNGNDTYSFTFPKVLVQDEYLIKYQTRPEVIENEDLLWNTLEFSDEFLVEDPDPVIFSLEKLNDVYCYGGSDGRFQITASGGSEEGSYQYRINNEGDWTDFDDPNTHTVNGQKVGNYEVAVRRVNGNAICAGQDQGGDEVNIDQPQEPVSTELSEFVEPTAFGFTNGSITVDVSGGTPYQNGSYDYTWVDANNNPINTTSALVVGNLYQITLEAVASGSYTLTVTDANYSNADDQEGCVFTQEFELPGPPPLQLTIEESQPISCNSGNAYGNPSNDGQLTAIASGGVPPYEYFWSKKDGNDDWQAIPNNNSEILSNLEAGEYAVNIQDANEIVIGIYENNVLQQATPVAYTLEEPELLTVQIEKTDVNCFGGFDGTATAMVSGGTPPFTYEWTSGANSQTAQGLWQGTHSVYVLDALGCEAEAEVTIGQPDEAVSITNPVYVEPTANGFTNGSITVQVNGGTPFNDDSYHYEWRDEGNNLINTTTAESIPEGYAIQVFDIPAGIYTITVTDANYENAEQKEGCTYTTELVLTEPPPLVLSVEQTIPISCNGGNQFNNPADDGQLMAMASGGVPFDPLIDGQYGYIFTWKKKDEQNNWQIIPNVTGNVLDNVDAGEYAVNIEDANGIVLGFYVNNQLQEATDYLYPVQETDPITLQLDKMDVSCYAANDGFATVAIQGGLPPYDISWSSGANSEVAENLAAGTYFVYIKDFYGCEASGQVNIHQPEELVIEVLDTVSPSCFDAQDGGITVAVTGGIAPYNYLWSNGETALNINNLAEGSYTLEVLDATGCTTSKAVSITAPFPSAVTLGEDRTLCLGQQHYLDISISDPAATYEWTSNNGFFSTAPQVALSEAGIYTATVTNSLGCSGSDTIEITTSQVEIDAQFLMSSQAFVGEEVVLVNTSDPVGTEENWVFPDEATVLEQTSGTAVIRFDAPGTYELILRNFQGECYQDIVKTIIVTEATELSDVGDAISPFIQEFIVSPNPSTGSFTVMVSLQETSEASLRVFGLTTNQVHHEETLGGSADYEVPFTLNLPSGVYLVLLETPKASQIRKIVIL
ncbi:T9SS type A sorting domain-containing protein [Flagellimonas marinaquae]|uniref:T9SS type A sorting domain-containing protein n=1 Tax=Flagellimonas marinaquae TaxID=254955 RepID=UPI0013DEDC5C|nr:T9SS type A sorting domain-containing protein [Allomuricauda aquimarina]